MGLIRCTRKVLTEMGIKSSSPDRDQDPAEELALWYANLVYLSGKKCLIITNPATCFSLVVPCLRRAEIKNLPDIFIKALNQALRDEGVEDEVIARVVALFETTQIGTTKDRRPLGVMNDLAHHIRAHLAYDYCGDPSLIDSHLQRKMNRIPWSGLKFHMAIEHLRRILVDHYGHRGEPVGA